MILKAVILFKSLSSHQYLVIILTIILPAILFRFLESWTSCELVLAIVYVVWAVIAVLSVASMLEKDRLKAEQSIARRLEKVSNDLKLLKDENIRKTTGLQDRLTEMDRVYRSAFEELGIVLPPPRIRLRGSITAETGTSATLSVVNPRRIVRLWSWVRRQALRFWRWFYG